MPNQIKQTALLGLSLQELTELVTGHGEPSYRAQQLWEGLYRQRVDSLESVTSLPRGFRESLMNAGFCARLPTTARKFHSKDGTVRYLIAFDDCQSVETVWMPEGDHGEEGDGTDAGSDGRSHPNRGRATICVSSQVGCAVGCEFCLTAQLGIKRNLSAGEIVSQVCSVLDDQKVSPPIDRVNLVFMGMGEPLLNFENFIKAVRLLVDGVGIPESRMTVSTSGIVPGIYDLGLEGIRPKLAISLNAPNDELRSRIMPINRKWNLEKLIAAARDFPLRNREKLTFEYVLLKDVNDLPEHAREVAELIRGIRAKVNLIALNPGPGILFETPTQESISTFQQILNAAGIPTFVRRPRGLDIYAACGQLKRTEDAGSPLAAVS